MAVITEADFFIAPMPSACSLLNEVSRVLCSCLSPLLRKLKGTSLAQLIQYNPEKIAQTDDKVVHYIDESPIQIDTARKKQQQGQYSLA